MIERQARRAQLLFQPLEAVRHLRLHERLGSLDLDVVQHLLEDPVANLRVGLHRLDLLDPLRQIGAQLVERLELRRRLRELVVQRRKLLLTDFFDEHLERDFLPGVLAAEPFGDRRVELHDVAGPLRGQLVVELFDRPRRAELVQLVVAGQLGDLVAVERRVDVHEHVVAGARGTLYGLERGEPILHALQLIVDLLRRRFRRRPCGR